MPFMMPITDGGKSENGEAPRKWLIEAVWQLLVSIDNKPRYRSFFSEFYLVGSYQELVPTFQLTRLTSQSSDCSKKLCLGFCQLTNPLIMVKFSTKKKHQSLE